MTYSLQYDAQTDFEPIALLAITAVLDERGQVDDSTAAKDGTTTRTARRKRATAKKQPKQHN